MKKPIAFIIALFTQVVAMACGNEYYYTPTEIPYVKGRIALDQLLFDSTNGENHFGHYWANGFGDNIWDKWSELKAKINPNTESNEVSWRDIEAYLKKDFKLVSDFAWYELRVGNKEFAVRILEKLYELHPNEYNVLANLGTAYEVTGNDQKALAILRKAVAINPQSHHGSEWIHIRILEEKLNPKPQYTRILNLNATEDFTAWLKEMKFINSISPDSLQVQLAYQLHERISFVGRPDPIVGQLVLDFADLVAKTDGLIQASAFYDYAVSYDAKLKAEVNKRMDTKLIPVTKVENKKKSSKLPIFVGLGVGVLVLLLVQRKKKASRIHNGQ